MAVYIAKNLNKERKVFNTNGDEIDLETRRVIRYRKEEGGLTPAQSLALQEKLRKQEEMEVKGIKPENWEDIIK